jgi:hypothetical protein
MVMESIYNGDFRPSEAGIGDDSGMWDLIKEIDVLQTELKRNLDEIDYQMVEQLVDKLLQQHFLEAQAHFCSGFSAGLLLIQEARALGEKQMLPR